MLDLQLMLALQLIFDLYKRPGGERVLGRGTMRTLAMLCCVGSTVHLHHCTCCPNRDVVQLMVPIFLVMVI